MPIHWTEDIGDGNVVDWNAVYDKDAGIFSYGFESNSTNIPFAFYMKVPRFILFSLIRMAYCLICRVFHGLPIGCGKDLLTSKRTLFHQKVFGRFLLHVKQL